MGKEVNTQEFKNLKYMHHVQELKYLYEGFQLALGNESLLSRQLGISRGTLRTRLKKHFGEEYRKELFNMNVNKLYGEDLND